MIDDIALDIFKVTFLAWLKSKLSNNKYVFGTGERIIKLEGGIPKLEH